jgi:pectinesterase
MTNCRLTSDAADGTVYLGRPWHPGGDPDAIASVLYHRCDLGAHIKPEGWTDMSGFSAADARLYEYENTGPGAISHEDRRQLAIMWLRNGQLKTYWTAGILKLNHSKATCRKTALWLR